MKKQRQQWWISVVICLSVAFCAQVYGHEGSTTLQMVPLGPIVLQANLP